MEQVAWVKVQMQGVAVDQALDLMTLGGYEELIDKLDVMFELDGEVRAGEKWDIFYKDSEGDIMAVDSDDPWDEFRNIAKTLFICSSQTTSLNPAS